MLFVVKNSTIYSRIGIFPKGSKISGTSFVKGSKTLVKDSAITMAFLISVGFSSN